MRGRVCEYEKRPGGSGGQQNLLKEAADLYLLTDKVDWHQ